MSTVFHTRILIIDSCNCIIDKLALNVCFPFFQTVLCCSKVEQNKIGRKHGIFIWIKVV